VYGAQEVWRDLVYRERALKRSEVSAQVRADRCPPSVIEAVTLRNKNGYGLGRTFKQRGDRLEQVLVPREPAGSICDVHSDNECRERLANQ